MNPVVGDDKSKEEKKTNPVQFYVKFSFSITYIFLLTTATITFIEAMRTNTPTVRHVINLETAVSLIASYFYSVFLEKISVFEKEDREIDGGEKHGQAFRVAGTTGADQVVAVSKLPQ